MPPRLNPNGQDLAAVTIFVYLSKWAELNIKQKQVEFLVKYSLLATYQVNYLLINYTYLLSCSHKFLICN